MSQNPQIASTNTDSLTPELLLPESTQNIDSLALDNSPQTPQITRDSSGKWVKGYCPNPGGRSKMRFIREALQEKLNEGDADKLAKMLMGLAKQNKNKALRLAAIREVADRTEGRPVQAMVVQSSVDDRTLDRMADLAERLANLAK